MNSKYIFIGLVLFYFSSCSSPSDSGQNVVSSGDYVCQSSPLTKGSRQFGMDILDVPSVGTYMDSFNYLKSLGGEFQTFHTTWDTLEAAGSGSTSGAFSDPGNGLASLNSLAVSDGIKVTLRIHPVDLPGKFVPSDLVNERFNSTNMQTRFRALIDYVFTRINPNHVTRLVIGNEIDSYNPGVDVNFWLDYADFLFNLNAWLNVNYPGVEIGFVITLDGATNPTKVLASSGGQFSINVLGDSGWAQVVDFVGITYYPLDSSFVMKSNSLVSNTFQNLVNFTSKPIHIEEIGYSSSTTNSGSEDLQSEFFCEVFKAWDTHQSRIPSLAILRMVDKTRLDAETVATNYGLTGNENFIEYIRTLGIRTNNNSAKKSFNLIQQELQKRNF